MKGLFHSFLLSFLLLTSCDKRFHFEVQRVVANNSSVPVEIIVYDEGGIINAFSISSGAEQIDTDFCETGAFPSCPLIWNRVRDSVRVVFDNEREVLFCSESQDCYSGYEARNIMLMPFFSKEDMANGYVRTSDGDIQIYTYTITEEDYENAEPIDEGG